VLAQAGVNRLNIDLSRFRCFTLSPALFVPAPAQGVLAYQIRENDAKMAAVMKHLNHADVAEQIYIERKTLNLFDGGCQLPLGVYCDAKMVYAAILPLDGKPFRRLAIALNQTNPESLKNALLKTSNKKVFISRASEDATLFIKTLSSYGCAVIAKPFIEIKPIKIAPIDVDVEWIFFSSVHGVEYGQYLLNQYPNALIGAVGNTTAQQIKSLGFTCSFVGDDSKTSVEIAKDFSAVARGNVIFPEALHGHRTIQKNNTGNYQSVSVPVYQTIEKPIITKPLADVYAFTSSSNVKSFINQFGLPEGDVFAIGEKTAETLREAGISKVNVAQLHTMQNLADVIAGSL
jgi:uroporphyrinogen-III synthase